MHLVFCFVYCYYISCPNETAHVAQVWPGWDWGWTMLSHHESMNGDQWWSVIRRIVISVAHLNVLPWIVFHVYRWQLMKTPQSNTIETGQIWAAQRCKKIEKHQMIKHDQTMSSKGTWRGSHSSCCSCQGGSRGIGWHRWLEHIVAAIWMPLDILDILRCSGQLCWDLLIFVDCMLIASDGHSDVLAHFGPGDQIMTICPWGKLKNQRLHIQFWPSVVRSGWTSVGGDHLLKAHEVYMVNDDKWR